MADKKTYLENVSIEGFDNIIPRRNAIIEKASAEFPKYEYNANVLARKLHPNVQHVVITAVKQMKDAKLYTLAPNKKAGTQQLAYFRAGQYISVSLKIGKSVLTRPYSLCGSPAEALNGTYNILVKSMKDGFASEYIYKNWKKGTKLDISEPCGFFNYEPIRDEKNVIALAGGSGIAPFISMAKAVADDTDECDSLTILYGSKKEEEILCREELDEIAAKSDKVKVVYVLSDEQKEGFENGFITADMIKKYAPENDKYSVFVCGSQGMYDFVEGEAEKLGLDRKHLRLDAYGEYKLSDKDAEFTKDNKGKTYTLTVVTSDGTTHTIPASADESILTAFERAGLTAPSKCRSGECGFCRSRLVEGSVYTPEKVEKRREYDKDLGYIHPCCTFPSSDCRIFINYEEPEIRRSVKDMKKKNRQMGLIMSVIISAAMGALAAYLVLKTNPQAAQGTPVPMMYISNIVLSIIVGVIVALTIPLGKLGRALANKANANPPSMKFTVLNALPLSIGNTFIVSLVVSLFGVYMGRANAPAEALAQMPPFAIMWLGSWSKLLLPTLIASYVLAVIFSPIVSQMVGLADAGAEVGRAAATDTSIKKDK